MRFLFLCVNDWANTGFEFAEALRAVGQHVDTFKIHPHPFGYPRQMEPAVVPAPDGKLVLRAELLAAWEAADVIHFHHESAIEIQGASLSGKIVTIHHGGSQYRMDPDAANRYWNVRAQAAIVETADLLDLGAVNESWIMPPVDTKALRPPSRLRSHNRLQVGHFPSDTEKKGTRAIIAAFKRLKDNPAVRDRFDWEVGRELVPWSAQVARIARCDVYVDQLMPELWGKPCGEYGVSAREAAALGCVVVANHRARRRFELEYGPTEIVVADDLDVLESALFRLLMQPEEWIRQKRAATRRWAVRHFSYGAVGKRLMDQVYRPLAKARGIAA